MFNLTIFKSQAYLKPIAYIAPPILLGQLTTGLAFALMPDIISRIGLDILPIPAWFFIGLWVVIYGGMGMAVWVIQQAKIGSHARVLFGFLIAGYLQTHLFWLTDSFRTTAITDATGIIFSVTCFWAIWQYTPKAALWLLPWVVWMPITLALKIAAIYGAFG